MDLVSESYIVCSPLTSRRKKELLPLDYKTQHGLSPVVFLSFISYSFPGELTSHDIRSQLSFIQYFLYTGYDSKAFTYITFFK